MISEFQNVLINLRGHNLNPNEFVKLSTLANYWQSSINSALLMFDSLKRYPDMEIFKTYKDVGYVKRCSICNESIYLEQVEDGKFQAAEECSAPNGYPTFDVVLDCPSGKMVWGNDFRDIIPVDEGPDGINATKGIVNVVKAYENAGMFHILVGNSCPSIFQRGDSELCISREYDEDLDESKSPGDGYVDVASICTDLWWVCGMDYDLFKSLCDKTGISEDDLGVEKVIDVKPGRWVFSFDPMKGCEFTTCYGKHQE
jgi:hypothetical protein